MTRLSILSNFSLSLSLSLFLSFFLSQFPCGVKFVSAGHSIYFDYQWYLSLFLSLFKEREIATFPSYQYKFAQAEIKKKPAEPNHVKNRQKRDFSYFGHDYFFLCHFFLLQNKYELPNETFNMPPMLFL
jgi:hypothetical protein